MHEQWKNVVTGSTNRSGIGAVLKHHIGGTWRQPNSDASLHVQNPSTGLELAKLAPASPKEVGDAVAAASAAFEKDEWRKLSPDHRGRLLWELAELIEQHSEELAMLESLDQGQPLNTARQLSVAAAAHHFRYFAGWPSKWDGRVPQVNNRDCLVLTEHVPLGVCALITPWNFPLMIAAWKLAPALATGNTVVIKPAESTPLTTSRLIELVQEAGFPDGVVNLIHGDGATGETLAGHPDVAKISFTGSTRVGKQLAQTASHDLRRVTLELGGKAASVITANADLDKSVALNVRNALNNAGQVCGALSRFYVHEDIYDECVKKLREAMENVVVGDGLDAGTTMGPLATPAQHSRVSQMVEEAVASGASKHEGGQIKGQLKGNFLLPTLLTDVREEMAVAREEIFGPVLPVMKYSDEKDLINRINDSPYGLAASVWSQDIDEALRISGEISAGVVRVNTPAGIDPASPWGGLRESGWGREMGPEALDAYTETKTTWIGVQRS